MANDFKKLVQADKGLVERKIFSDEELYELELKQIFGRSWLFVGHESQLPKANAFIGGWMAQDPIIVTRDARDKFHVFLNMCRRGGAKVTKEDVGNNEVFECPQHGCLYNMEGQLVAVPGYDPEEVKKIDQTEYGLVPAAHLETYKGLIFATWDEQAPKLLDYLGDMTWYLDLLVDRRSGGTEVIGGVHKWVIQANWKYGAENFFGDDGHHPITHASVRRAMPDDRFYTQSNEENVMREDDPLSVLPAGIIRDYYREHFPELVDRVGPERARQSHLVTTVFPNCSLNFGRHMVRVWHPRGPNRTEIWSYFLVDKDAPPEVKDAMRLHLTQTFGPAGNVEEDDMDNWVQCTETGRGAVARRYLQNIQAGLGHDADLPAVGGGFRLRAFYARWADLMDAPDWSRVAIDIYPWRLPWK